MGGDAPFLGKSGMFLGHFRAWAGESGLTESLEFRKSVHPISSPTIPGAGVLYSRWIGNRILIL
jgi:hypothetical protein